MLIDSISLCVSARTTSRMEISETNFFYYNLSQKWFLGEERSGRSSGKGEKLKEFWRFEAKP